MFSIDKNGRDSDGETWVLHASIAKAIKGTLEPFDKYQGPYIVVGGKDIRVGNKPYDMPVRHLGIVRLWIVGDEEEPEVLARIYREDNDTLSDPFMWNDNRGAIRQARKILTEGGETKK